ncbi:MAG TPA: hypothetical protein VGR46_09510 [Candidatus Limnocylindria bacterium]|nr:hypothetical protein [Candidatus Limnocylindria bacterium]
MRRLAIFALAITTCVARAPSTPTPSATPTPPARAVTASPSPTLAPLRLGLVVPTSSALLDFGLRTESDPQPFAPLVGALYPVVSPDGRRLAYWHRDTGAGDTKDALRAMELTSGEEIELLRLENERAGGIGWRDDAAALVFAATSVQLASGVNPPPLYAALRTVEVGGHQSREVRRFDRTRISPVAWSASTHVIAGQDTGEGGLRVLFRIREDGSSPGDTQGERRFNEIVDVTRDAKSVLAQFAYAESNKTFSGTRIVGADSPRPIAEHEVPQGAFLIRARFRPGTEDVLALVRAADSGRYALELWPSGGSTSRVIWTSAASATTSGDLVMRVDGKAAYVRTDAAAGSTWQMVDLDSGAATAFAAGAVGITGGPSFVSPSFFISDAAITKLRR